MDDKPAPVVVACLFAGLGATAGTFVQEAGDAPTYAVELFGVGAGALSVSYPTCASAESNARTHPRATCDVDGTPGVSADEGASTTVMSKPWVRLHFAVGTGEITVGGANGALPAMEQVAGAPGTNTKGTVTFSLSNGAFADTVTLGNFLGTGAAVRSIVEGGNKGDDSVTFGLDGEIANGNNFTFILPNLTGLSGKGVSVSASSRAVAGDGTFPTGAVTSMACFSPATDAVDADTGKLTAMLAEDGTISGTVGQAARDAQLAAVAFGEDACGAVPTTVLKVDDAVTLVMRDSPPPKAINLDERAMLVDAPKDPTPQETQVIGVTLTTSNKGGMIKQLDGTPVGSELAGDVTVSASGSMTLFHDGDNVIVRSGTEADKPRTSTKKLELDDDSGQFVGSALPIAFGEVHYIDVYYAPGPKMELSHGSKVTVSVAVDYSRDTAVDEKALMSTATLNFAGVAHSLKAYALPHVANSMGDQSNLRVRCEDGVKKPDDEGGGSECRIFLECWDDYGNREFGEADPAVEGGVRHLNSMEIEEAIMVEDGAMSRLSCRVLATGVPSVQVLVRDGHSNTLVNNTYVADGE